jgi:mycothione reductase
MTREYDVIVIGSGSGMGVVSDALEDGLKVALVDRGPLGGTCPNLGCIPTKVLVYPADRVMEIREAAKLGIEARIEKVDFGAVMAHMRRYVGDILEGAKTRIVSGDNFTFYNGQGRFVAENTIEVNGEQIKADRIAIVCGSRPVVPPIPGLAGVDYITNEGALELTVLPESLIIIGGGYIAVEFGHFFEAMGSQVTMIEMMDRLVTSEEPEISDLLLTELRKRMEVLTGTRAIEVKSTPTGVTVVTEGSDGQTREVSAAKLMLAVGRRPNTDTLDLEKTGVKLDPRGYVEVDEYLETSRPGIYASGDANGHQMFTHMANYEADVVSHNMLREKSLKVDYHAAPHAAFTHPQIASVGLRQAEAAKDHHVLIGQAHYRDVVKGEAMLEEQGFAKAIVDADTDAILGFHIIGPYAPILIQEVTAIMAAGGTVEDVFRGIHIHPAMPELIQSTLGSLNPPE